MTGAQFVIVDEGPGRSGSTFLSVAEALVRAGVARSLITLVGSRQTNPASLFATDAASRWNSFRFLSTLPLVSTRFERYRYLGGGEWRGVFLPQREHWPESWTQMERLKFMAPDHHTLVKFEGMGWMGKQSRERAILLGEEGFAPAVVSHGEGFVEYAIVRGKRLRACDLTSQILERMASYCAFRAAACRVSETVTASLQEMVQFNLHQEFGVELSLGEGEMLPRVPVLVDGRMQPHEWIASATEGLIKTDGVSHGDDHFFPGPCDVAWDLAGAAIEWDLDREEFNYLVEQFRLRSGINVSSYLHFYLIAYSIFRLGFTRMAMPTVDDTDERERLKTAYWRYRRRILQLLEARPDRVGAGLSAA